MKQGNRRRFLRQFGLAVGALSIAAGEAPAFVYQKKPGIRRAAPTAIDHRYAPPDWHSPLRYPGAGGKAFVGREGSLLRPGEGAGSGTIEIFIDGAGPVTSIAQRCEGPHIPFVVTSLSYGESSVGMQAFSSSHEDEGDVDNITISVSPSGASPALRLVLWPGASLTTEIEEDDDKPNGGVCYVRRKAGDDDTFLVLDARPVVSHEGDALVLTMPAGSAGPGPRVFNLRVPAGRSDEGDVASGIRRLDERAKAEHSRWDAWKTSRGPAGWELPGAYGDFAVAAARIIDQLTPAAQAGNGEKTPVAPQPTPDFVDEHFISEAELYIGRGAEAKRRLEAVWKHQDESGLLIGAGGEANMKEMCAAVYSLCRQAELTGDWTMFSEYYPDAFNALDSLKVRRDKASALPEKRGNARWNLLPEGSPGRGWSGLYGELTNTIWALMALKLMLEISARQFLMKESMIREFYGQLRLALNTAIRETTQTHAAGFSWFPVVTAPAGDPAAGAPGIPPQAGLGTFSLALFPGMLYKGDDKLVQGYAQLVSASLENDVPAGTGPGGAGTIEPVDAALAAQALTWFTLPEDARKLFVGFLNHASPVYTWTPAAAPVGAAPLDLRATAESIRFIRHAMVLEDEGVLRLFEGVAIADLAGGKALKIDGTPTRWGRVSVALEPVDARTWKASYRREPVNPEKGPELKSIEMPRVLGPNFRFDTISPGSAIKNGPRVLIDAAPLQWEAYLRDLRR